MTVDRETRDRLADLAAKARDAWPSPSVPDSWPWPHSAFASACSPRTVLALLADLDTAERLVERFAPRCSQCGEPFTETACGPTHAVIAADPSQYGYAGDVS